MTNKTFTYVSRASVLFVEFVVRHRGIGRTHAVTAIGGGGLLLHHADDGDTEVDSEEVQHGHVEHEDDRERDPT